MDQRWGGGATQEETPRRIGGDAIEPGGEAGTAVVAVEVRGQPDQYTLGHVIRVIGISGTYQRLAIHLGVTSFDEPAEGLLVSRLRLTDEVLQALIRRVECGHGPPGLGGRPGMRCGRSERRLPRKGRGKREEGSGKRERGRVRPPEADPSPFPVLASPHVTDRVGFEPTNRLPGYTLSRRVPSATRPPVPGCAVPVKNASQAVAVNGRRWQQWRSEERVRCAHGQHPVRAGSLTRSSLAA